jgi:putative ABC transport system permease protein
MLLRLIVEPWRRRRRRTLAALVTVALGTLCATAIASVVLTSGDQLASALSSYGANIEVRPLDGRPTLPTDDLGALDRIFWRNNLKAIAPRFSLRVRYLPSQRVAPLVGTWFDHPLAHWHTGLPDTRPGLAVHGRWPHEAAAEIAVGRRLAERLGVAAGGRLALALGDLERRVEVVGIVESGGDEEDAGFVPLELAQQLAGRPGEMTGAEISALTVPEQESGPPDPSALNAEEYDAWYCTAYPSAVALQIGEALPGGRAEVVREVAGAGGALLRRVRAVLLAVAVALLLGAMLGISSTLAATLRERRGEMALLLALGASRGRVIGLLVAQVAALGALGGLAGGLAGTLTGPLLGRPLFGLTVPWTPVLLPVAVAAGAGVALAAAWRPARSVLGEAPARVLAGAVR